MSSAMMSKASSRCAVRPSRSSVVVRASAEQVDRRAVLGAAAAAFGVMLAGPQQAQAMKMPWQESTGGMLSGGGSTPKSATEASMSGYTMEGFPGTKKPSFIGASEKKKLRREARELAMKEAK